MLRDDSRSRIVDVQGGQIVPQCRDTRRLNPDDRHSVHREWNDLGDITSRTQVIGARARWEALADEILGTVNDLLTSGDIEGRPFIESFRTGGLTGLLMTNAPEVEEAIRQETRSDTDFDSQVESWWISHGAEYFSGSREAVLSQAILANWIAKFLFASILRDKDDRARIVEEIRDDTTPREALDIFRHLSEEINFWTIFSDFIGLDKLTVRAWQHLLQFNKLLRDLRIGSVDQAQLSDILETTVEVTTRKLRGQYPTPLGLARLLARLSTRNITDDRVIDPCCGSGTIAAGPSWQGYFTGGAWTRGKTAYLGPWGVRHHK